MTCYLLLASQFTIVAIIIERSIDRPCARDMCNTARSFTHESNTCVIRRLAFLNLGFIDLLSCTPLLGTQPRVAEFWFVHETQNLEIALREVGDYREVVVAFGIG